MEHGTEWVGESWDELKFIRQVRGYQGALVLSRREVRASGLLHVHADCTATTNTHQQWMGRRDRTCTHYISQISSLFMEALLLELLQTSCCVSCC